MEGDNIEVDVNEVEGDNIGMEVSRGRSYWQGGKRSMSKQS